MRKYVLYAIGEIILVMIGILLALQINNWNEEKKEEEALHAVYDIIVEDLVADIKNIDNIFEYYKIRKENYRKIIDRELTKKEIYGNESLIRYLISTSDFQNKKRGYKLLLNFTKKKQSKINFNITQFYLVNNASIEFDYKLMMSEVNDTWSKWKKKYTWFPLFSESLVGLKSFEEIKKDKEFINYVNYVLNDQDYINRTASYHSYVYGLFLIHLESYKQEALQIIGEIKSLKK